MSEFNPVGLVGLGGPRTTSPPQDEAGGPGGPPLKRGAQDQPTTAIRRPSRRPQAQPTEERGLSITDLANAYPRLRRKARKRRATGSRQGSRPRQHDLFDSHPDAETQAKQHRSLPHLRRAYHDPATPRVRASSVTTGGYKCRS